MQIVYLLNTHDFGVTQIAQSTDEVLQVTFSKDSKLILVLWLAGDSQRYQTYSCSGLRMAFFVDPYCVALGCRFSASPLVHLSGSRIAIAHPASFSVWKLDQGQLLGSADTGSLWALCGRRALIGTNSTCSKLLYSLQMPSAVYVYDAVSLELLSTLLPQTGCGSQVLRSHVSDSDAILTWGAYGCLVSQNVQYQSGGESSRPVELLQFQAEPTSCRVTSLGQAGNMFDRLTLSPCGAYFCRFDGKTSHVQITDVRSAETVLRGTLMPAMCGRFDANICWSSCSAKLMILVCDPRGFKTCEHLFVLQFC